MGSFGEYIKSAFASILNNKGRSFLTMLGIIIGISAVITVLIIGDGMKATVNSTMDSIGATTITVSLDDNKTDKAFSKDNLDEIERSIDKIYGISPSIQRGGTVQGRTESYDIIMTGAGEAAENGSGIKMVHGRYFTRADVDDAKKVIVISQIMAKKVLGYEEVVGRTLEISAYNQTDTYTICGVREDTPMDTTYASFADFVTYNVDMPYTSMASSFNINIDTLIKSFTIYLDNDDKNEVLLQTRAVVETVMGIRGENAVKISSGAGFDKTTDSIMTIITSVVALIAAISLLVGGIGVMNIMTVSVTERTREIGIRKSLGARTSSILTQFLAEAAILTFTGGIIGILFGLTVSFIICKVVDFAFIVNPYLIAGVVMVSTAIGLFFGIYPAKRAAKLDPIEALRTE